ncbi:MAG: UbiA family prenyltransferase [Planctomycetota bacterium]
MAGYITRLGCEEIPHTIIPRLICAGVASMAAFCFGASFNDYLDRNKDAKLAPERPIPSGLLTPGMALSGAWLMAATAIGAAAICGTQTFLAMGAVLLLIASYNLWTRRSDIGGVITLGAVRAMDLLVGASLTVPSPSASSNGPDPQGIPTLVAMFVYGLYCICLSTIALNERSQKKLDLRLPAAGAAGMALLPVMYLYTQGTALPAFILWSVLVFPIYRSFTSNPIRVEPLVGHMVSGFFLLSALFVLTWGHPVLCASLWGAFFLSKTLARWFPPA